MIEARKDLPAASSQFALTIAIFSAVALFGAGCANFRMTNPPRSATEQLLLSASADRALATPDLRLLTGRKIFVDMTYFGIRPDMVSAI
jgi:hypothetical protein